MTAVAPIFVSHGAPTLALEPGLAGAMLADLGASQPAPRAILLASAHWEARGTAVTTTGQPSTLYDFGGFPAALYALRYPAPGAPEVARSAAARLTAAGFAVREDPTRGLDHGAWVPLMHLFPSALIPVAQIALSHGEGARRHFELGQALAPLTADGVMIMGSGSLTHNLYEAFRHPADAPADPTVAEFVDWIEARLQERDIPALLDYRNRAPHARRHHPTEEHLMPLFVALGAAGPEAILVRHAGGTSFGVLSMDAFAAHRASASI